MNPEESQTNPNRDAEEMASLFGFHLSDEKWIERVHHATAAPPLGRLGDFELLEEVAYGGQGVVYRALEIGRDRDVALKCIRRHLLAGGDFRFQREIEAAGILHHPFIVNVYRAELLDGRPTLAMEWVEGVPTDDWMWQGEDSLRPPAETLAVFSRICEAVQHAHQHGVIHRDLKPSNILVDGEDNPHVLDFGLAKLMSTREQQGQPQTIGFVGTPQYSSPEQLQPGQPIDARGDVYSLCVILFEMLTSRRPIEVSGGMAVLMSAIAESEPPRPSSLNKELDRELDAIVLKGLEKSPERRYQSVDALAADVQRYLRGEPVLAHPPSFLYQLRKLISRNRVIAALTAAILLLLISALVVTAVQARRLEEQRQAAMESRQNENMARLAAERARDAEYAEAERAQAILNFLLHDLLLAADARRENDSLSVDSILDRAARKLESLQGRPEIEAAVRQVVGTVLMSHGRLGEAQQEFEKALALREALLTSEGHEDCLETRNSLAYLHKRRGNLDAALEMLESILPDARALAESSPCRLAETLNNLTIYWGEQGELERAQGFAEEIQKLDLQDCPIQQASAQYNLGLVLFQQGSLQKARSLLEASLELHEGILGTESLEYALVCSHLASTYRLQGKSSAADEMRQRVLRVAQEPFAASNPEFAQLLNSAAMMESQVGNQQVAEKYLREAVAILEGSGFERHHLGKLQANLAGILAAQWRREEAEQSYRKAVQTVQQGGSDPLEQATVYAEFANFLNDHAESWEEAAEFFLRVLQLEEAVGEHHPTLVLAQARLGLVLQRLGRMREASTHLEAAHRKRAALADRPLDLATLLLYYGNLLVQTGNPEDGEPALLECLRIRKEVLPPSSLRIVDAAQVLCDGLLALDEVDQAEELLLETYNSVRDALGAEHHDVVNLSHRILRFYRDLDEPDRALEFQDSLR